VEDGPALFAVLGLPPPTPPEPPRPEAPGSDHIASAIAAQLEAILTCDPGVRLGTDPEAVHLMRVATRRLRAYLRVARPVLGRARVEHVRSELSWLGDVLGAVRDLDVFLGYLRDEGTQLLSETVATFGLLLIIGMCARRRPSAVPFAVAAYITAAYWFTASTSFANPAVTLARAFSDSFAGIRPADVPGFILAQAVGGAAAVVVVRWLLSRPAANDPETE
jgi:inorganic triphosphatase YgiF